MNNSIVKDYVDKIYKYVDAYDKSNRKDILRLLYQTLTNLRKECNHSDWISVLEDYPPYDKRVLVTNKNKPEVGVWMSRRLKDSPDTDIHGFDTFLQVTHWTHLPDDE